MTGLPLQSLHAANPEGPGICPTPCVIVESYDLSWDEIAVYYGVKANSRYLSTTRYRWQILRDPAARVTAPMIGAPSCQISLTHILLSKHT